MKKGLEQLVDGLLRWEDNLGETYGREVREGGDGRQMSALDPIRGSSA